MEGNHGQKHKSKSSSDQAKTNTSNLVEDEGKPSNSIAKSDNAAKLHENVSGRRSELNQSPPRGNTTTSPQPENQEGNVDATQRPLQQEETGPKANDHEGQFANQPQKSLQDINVEAFFDSSSEEDFSARDSGSSIGLESSNSKIPAETGIPKYVLKSLNVSTLEEALEKLLAGIGPNSNIEGTSACSAKDKENQFEQETLELKFKQDFIHNNALENHQLFISGTQAREAHATLWAQANECHEEDARMKAKSTRAFLKVAACEDKIAKWKPEIRELESKIAEEESQKQRYAKLAIEVPRVEIEAKAKVGLQLVSDARIIHADVQRLTDENDVLKLKLSQTKELYRAFQRSALNNIYSKHLKLAISHHLD
ncbi:hypothetical protein TSUD_00140 [Trifolium subterraneum]|nr:hypothetical protein TSUD_00140 [Trifolium subterraneum]